MRNFIFLFFLLAICNFSWAQRPVTHMLSTSPSYNTKYNYLDEYFSTQYLISPKNRMDNVDESETKTTFYKFEIPFQYARELPKNFFLTLGYSRIYGEYNFSMTYWDSDVAFEKLQATEKVKITGGGVSAGIGKAFYFGESKKLMLLPNMRAYFTSSSFDGSYSSGTANNPSATKNESYGYYNQYGLTLGLQANYQFSKHFGLGLHMNNIVGFEHVEGSRGMVYVGDISEKNFVLNLKQTPQLHLIYYFQTKKGN